MNDLLHRLYFGIEIKHFDLKFKLGCVLEMQIFCTN